MKKQVLSLIMMAVIPHLGLAQNVVFSYDAAGNRILRTPSGSSSNAPGMEVCDVDSPIADPWQSLSVAPSPTNGPLHVRLARWSDSDKCHLLLSSLSGQVLIERTLTAIQTTLDLCTFPNGYYLLNVELNGEQKTFKIIKY